MASKGSTVLEGLVNRSHLLHDAREVRVSSQRVINARIRKLV